MYILFSFVGHSILLTNGGPDSSSPARGPVVGAGALSVGGALWGLVGDAARDL